MNHSKNFHQTPYLRVIALFILIAFITTNAFVLPAFAIPEQAHPSLKGTVPISFPIHVPPEIGKIEEVFQASSPRLQAAGECLKPAACSLQPVVILIQDAHAIPDAQRNIQKLIEHFQKQYGVGLVALEGASSELDSRIFRSFPDKEILQKTFNEYFEKGELTGSTAAAIFSAEGGSASGGNETVFHGIENWELYEKGVELYLKAMEKEGTIGKQLEAAGRKLQTEKQRTYSKELLEVDKTLESFRRNDTDLVTVLEQLNKRQIRGQVGVGSSQPVPLSIQTLLEEIAKEGEDSSAIEREVREIAEEVRKYLEQKSPQTTDHRRQKITIPWTVDRGLLAEFNEKYQAFQTSRISQAAFALFLKELIESGRGSWGMGLEKAYARLTTQDSRLSSLIKNHKHLRDIQGTQFFRDFEAFVGSVKESLFRNDEERNLDAESRKLELLEKLAKLELGREEWQEIQSLIDSTSYIDKNIWLAHWNFYRNAEARDRVFFNNLTKLSTKYDVRSTLLIAGGFHTEGLARQFKENGISYVIVRPEIKSIPEHSRYREHMQGEVSWKNYFEVENGSEAVPGGGKVNLYKAFVRATRDRLLRGQETRGRGQELSFFVSPVSRPLLKSWRDEILRDLAQKEKLAKADEYTKFLDEVAQDSRPKTQAALRQEWLANINRFTESLKKLESHNQLTEQNILKLLEPSTTADPVTYGVLSPHEWSAGISSLNLRSEVRSQTGPDFEAFKRDVLKIGSDKKPLSLGHLLKKHGIDMRVPGNERQVTDILIENGYELGPNAEFGGPIYILKKSPLEEENPAEILVLRNEFIGNAVKELQAASRLVSNLPNEFAQLPWPEDNEGGESPFAISQKLTINLRNFADLLKTRTDPAGLVNLREEIKQWHLDFRAGVKRQYSKLLNKDAAGILSQMDWHVRESTDLLLSAIAGSSLESTHEKIAYELLHPPKGRVAIVSPSQLQDFYTGGIDPDFRSRVLELLNWYQVDSQIINELAPFLIRSEIRQVQEQGNEKEKINAVSIFGDGEGGIVRRKRQLRGPSQRSSASNRSTWGIQSFLSRIEGYSKILNIASETVAMDIETFKKTWNVSKKLLANPVVIIRYVILANIPAIKILRSSPKKIFLGFFSIGDLLSLNKVYPSIFSSSFISTQGRKIQSVQSSELSNETKNTFLVGPAYQSTSLTSDKLKRTQTNPIYVLNIQPPLRYLLTNVVNVFAFMPTPLKSFDYIRNIILNQENITNNKNRAEVWTTVKESVKLQWKGMVGAVTKQLQELEGEEAFQSQRQVHAKIIHAFESVPRDYFVAPDLKDKAFENVILSLADGPHTLSQYKVVVDMLALAGPNLLEGPILEVGSGSGYVAALLSNINEKAQVYGLEMNPDLVESSTQILQEDLKIQNVHIERRNGTEGLKEHGPYALILVSAGATHIPQALVDQLKLGGALVMPLLGQLVRFVKTKGGELKRENTLPGPYRFVSFQGAADEEVLERAVKAATLWIFWKQTRNAQTPDYFFDKAASFGLNLPESFWKELKQLSEGEQRNRFGEELQKAFLPDQTLIRSEVRINEFTDLALQGKLQFKPGKDPQDFAWQLKLVLEEVDLLAEDPIEKFDEDAFDGVYQNAGDLIRESFEDASFLLIIQTLYEHQSEQAELVPETMSPAWYFANALHDLEGALRPRSEVRNSKGQETRGKRQEKMSGLNQVAERNLAGGFKRGETFVELLQIIFGGKGRKNFSDKGHLDLEMFYLAFNPLYAIANIGQILAHMGHFPTHVRHPFTKKSKLTPEVLKKNTGLARFRKFWTFFSLHPIGTPLNHFVYGGRSLAELRAVVNINKRYNFFSKSSSHAQSDLVPVVGSVRSEARAEPVRILLADKPASERTVEAIRKMAATFSGQVELIDLMGVGKDKDQDKNKDQLKDILQEKNPAVVVVRSGTTAFQDPEFVAFAKTNGVRAVIRMGAGVDNINTKAAKKAGISVIRTHGNANSVANLALRFLLAGLSVPLTEPALTDLSQDSEWGKIFDVSLDEFNKAEESSQNAGRGAALPEQKARLLHPVSPEQAIQLVSQLQGKTIGLLGFGPIAQVLAEKLNKLKALTGVSFTIMATSPALNREDPDRVRIADRLGVLYPGEDEVLKNSDILSFHLAGEAKNYFTLEKLVKAGKAKLIINTARQDVIAPEALKVFLTRPTLYFADIDLAKNGQPFKEIAEFLSDFSAQFYALPHIAASTQNAARGVEANTLPVLETSLNQLLGKQFYSDIDLDIVNRVPLSRSEMRNQLEEVSGQNLVRLTNRAERGEEVVGFIRLFEELARRGVSIEDHTGNFHFDLRTDQGKLAYLAPSGKPEALIAYRGIEIEEDKDFPEDEYPITLELDARTGKISSLYILHNKEKKESLKLEILSNGPGQQTLPLDMDSIQNIDTLSPDQLLLRASFIREVTNSGDYRSEVRIKRLEELRKDKKAELEDLAVLIVSAISEAKLPKVFTLEQLAPVLKTSGIKVLPVSFVKRLLKYDLLRERSWPGTTLTRKEYDLSLIGNQAAQNAIVRKKDQKEEASKSETAARSELRSDSYDDWQEFWTRFRQRVNQWVAEKGAIHELELPNGNVFGIAQMTKDPQAPSDSNLGDILGLVLERFQRVGKFNPHPPLKAEVIAIHNQNRIRISEIRSEVRSEPSDSDTPLGTGRSIPRGTVDWTGPGDSPEQSRRAELREGLMKSEEVSLKINEYAFSDDQSNRKFQASLKSRRLPSRQIQSSLPRGGFVGLNATARANNNTISATAANLTNRGKLDNQKVTRDAPNNISAKRNKELDNLSLWYDLSMVESLIEAGDAVKNINYINYINKLYLRSGRSELRTQVAALADDPTGRNEIEAGLRLQGFRVEGVNSSEDLKFLRQDHAAVVNLGTRHLEPNEVAGHLKKNWNQASFYKQPVLDLKIDSKMRGPIGALIREVAKRHKSDLILFTPVNPRQGQQVLNGELWITEEGQKRLLHESAYQTEVLMPPSATSSVTEILRFQEPVSGRSIVHVLLNRIREGEKKLKSYLHSLNRGSLVVFDSQTEEDLATIIKASSSLDRRILRVGSAGLLNAAAKERISKNPVPAEERNASLPFRSSRGVPFAFITTLNDVTRRQIKEAQKLFGDQIRLVEIDPRKITGKPVERQKERKRIQNFVRPLIRSKTGIILATKEKFQGKDLPRLKQREFQLALARESASILRDKEILSAIKYLFVSGGDGVEALEEVFHTNADLRGLFAQDVPWGIFLRGPLKGIPVVTKSGGFGVNDPELLAGFFGEGLKPALAISQGDPLGVGPEIAVRLFMEHPEILQTSNPFVIGNAHILREALKFIHENLPGLDPERLWQVRAYKDFRELSLLKDQEGDILPVIPVLDIPNELLEKILFSKQKEPFAPEIQNAAAKLVEDILDRASLLARQGSIDALIRNPINKSRIDLARKARKDKNIFIGHTEYLAENIGTAPALLEAGDRGTQKELETTRMILTHASKQMDLRMSVIHASTVHQSLKKAVTEFTSPDENIRSRAMVQTAEAILRAGRFARENQGVLKPRIAVNDLTPQTRAKSQEVQRARNVLRRAIGLARKKDPGLVITGPLAARDSYTRALFGQVDFVVALYHDQGHIPLKLASSLLDTGKILFKETRKQIYSSFKHRKGLLSSNRYDLGSLTVYLSTPSALPEAIKEYQNQSQTPSPQRGEGSVMGRKGVTKSPHEETLFKTIGAAYEDLKRKGVWSPRILVAAINPHAGEKGKFGREDEISSLPAILRAREAFQNLVINVDPKREEDRTPLPIAADAVFIKAFMERWDAVITVHQDQLETAVAVYEALKAQGLLLLRPTIAGVNVTEGLKNGFISTSVDHGTNERDAWNPNRKQPVIAASLYDAFTQGFDYVLKARETKQQASRSEIRSPDNGSYDELFSFLYEVEDFFPAEASAIRTLFLRLMWKQDANPSSPRDNRQLEQDALKLGISPEQKKLFVERFSDFAKADDGIHFGGLFYDAFEYFYLALPKEELEQEISNWQTGIFEPEGKDINGLYPLDRHVAYVVNDMIHQLLAIRGNHVDIRYEAKEGIPHLDLVFLGRHFGPSDGKRSFMRLPKFAERDMAASYLSLVYYLQGLARISKRSMFGTGTVNGAFSLRAETPLFVHISLHRRGKNPPWVQLFIHSEEKTEFADRSELRQGDLAGVVQTLAPHEIRPRIVRSELRKISLVIRKELDRDAIETLRRKLIQSVDAQLPALLKQAQNETEITRYENLQNLMSVLDKAYQDLAQDFPDQKVPVAIDFDSRLLDLFKESLETRASSISQIIIPERRAQLPLWLLKLFKVPRLEPDLNKVVRGGEVFGYIHLGENVPRETLNSRIGVIHHKGDLKNLDLWTLKALAALDVLFAVSYGLRGESSAAYLKKQYPELFELFAPSAFDFGRGGRVDILISQFEQDMLTEKMAARSA